MNRSTRPLRSLVLALALAVGAACAAAPAAADAFGFEVGVHGGVVNVPDGENAKAFGGVQARLQLIWLFSAEARASIYKDHYEKEGVGGIDVKNTPFQLSVLFYPLKLPRVGVYVLGGAGYHNVELTTTGKIEGFDATERKWAAHAGVGVDLKLYRGIWLNGDLRYYFLNVDTAGELGQAVLSNYKGDFWSLTAGVNVKLF